MKRNEEKVYKGQPKRRTSKPPFEKYIPSFNAYAYIFI